jgi:hypothetical protein
LRSPLFLPKPPTSSSLASASLKSPHRSAKQHAIAVTPAGKPHRPLLAAACCHGRSSCAMAAYLLSLSPRTFVPLAPLRRRRLLALGHHCLRVAGHHRWHCTGEATPPASHPHGHDPSLPFPLLLVLVHGRNCLATAIVRSGFGISRIENTLWAPCMPCIHAPRCMQEKNLETAPH